MPTSTTHILHGLHLLLTHSLWTLSTAPPPAITLPLLLHFWDRNFCIPCWPWTRCVVEDDLDLLFLLPQPPSAKTVGIYSLTWFVQDWLSILGFLDARQALSLPADPHSQPSVLVSLYSGGALWVAKVLWLSSKKGMLEDYNNVPFTQRSIGHHRYYSTYYFRILEHVAASQSSRKKRGWKTYFYVPILAYTLQREINWPWSLSQCISGKIYYM